MEAKNVNRHAGVKTQDYGGNRIRITIPQTIANCDIEIARAGRKRIGQPIRSIATIMPNTCDSGAA
ncbi:MAG: hypothetical protein A2161_00150 [Candidatus Schekmanbacteria bacterium RBG_13_48_7]|uniref:Uncharacterized protein n=1 Tax=Candidatus Schekmanbacteria bacterium RBG_13_48_7 TaxID=1817878 RepID=A0A1F7RY64_9BACT|nr:MAG: hypothetical protein A2161_00150 [Candidatus Schekmanbacteria bacterium RBG_13_48_7]